MHQAVLSSTYQLRALEQTTNKEQACYRMRDSGGKMQFVQSNWEAEQAKLGGWAITTFIQSYPCMVLLVSLTDAKPILWTFVQGYGWQM